MACIAVHHIVFLGAIIGMLDLKTTLLALEQYKHSLVPEIVVEGFFSYIKREEILLQKRFQMHASDIHAASFKDKTTDRWKVTWRHRLSLRWAPRVINWFHVSPGGNVKKEGRSERCEESYQNLVILLIDCGWTSDECVKRTVLNFGADLSDRPAHRNWICDV